MGVLVGDGIRVVVGTDVGVAVAVGVGNGVAESVGVRFSMGILVPQPDANPKRPTRARPPKIAILMEVIN